ncbi:uL15 family ribosomal protein [Caldivirga sp. UBA161]|uniref:uL15 family ribosomal protein n=1 Tax=Caldivirga sp. UBA161 TaxID=1915569 RepID=UPI0025C2D4DF|nr:uL15 family ribosomal protein [Caldivirga sp. UBA161]
MRRRDKKSRKLRGWRTHSWGRVGQHRSRGQRGGGGKIGLLKHKKSLLLKVTNGELYPLIGKHGFYRPSPEVKVINIGGLNGLIQSLQRRNLIKMEGDKYVIDLTQLGYGKLLGEGKIQKPVVVKVKAASARAIRAIKEAGGEVLIVQ